MISNVQPDHLLWPPTREKPQFLQVDDFDGRPLNEQLQSDSNSANFSALATQLCGLVAVGVRTTSPPPRTTSHFLTTYPICPSLGGRYSNMLGSNKRFQALTCWISFLLETTAKISSSATFTATLKDADRNRGNDLIKQPLCANVSLHIHFPNWDFYFLIRWQLTF